MKIGILTFHDGINHGAFLQAYSTFSYIKEKGLDVEIINYKNRVHHRNERRHFLFKKNPIKILEGFRKIRSFKSAQKLLFSGRVQTNIKNISYYDKIIVGSDVVWDYKKEFLGGDPTYFGIGLNFNKIYSYAPSFGNVTVKDELPSFVVNGLKSFSKISVRDDNSKDVIRKIEGLEASKVLDPTFLFDFENEKRNPETKPFLLVYGNRIQNDQAERILSFARERGLRTISIGYRNSWCDVKLKLVNPFEWLAYFKHASYVVSGTFHGTVFSLKLDKKFCVCNNEFIQPRVESLLKDLGMMDRILPENLSITSCLDQEIGRDNRSRLNQRIEESKKYMDSILNDLLQ